MTATPPKESTGGKSAGGGTRTHPSRIAAIALIVRRSLRRHAFATTITILATALAAGLVMSVFAIQAQTEAAFTGRDVGFDAVLGARGSKLQLVMNSVFHLDASPGNIPWSVYERLGVDPRVALAIPYAVGDNYKGFRIVGTTTDQFELYRYAGDRALQFAGNGRAFDPNRREAVIGSFVAQQTGLNYGDEFHPSHGISSDDVGDHHDHEEHYIVVGVLEPTNTPIDRVVWIPIDGIFRMGGHVLRGEGEPFVPKLGEAIPDEHKEVSAIMLKFRAPTVGAELDNVINREGKEMTLAWPIASIMADFFAKFGWITRVLRLVAYLVVAVSAGAILASVYNTINERRREFAILRALGARKSIVFTAIVIESAVIAGLGALVGYAVYAAIVAIATTAIRHQTGVVIEAWSFHPALALVPPGMILLGGIAGLIPALKAYRTDVATNLEPHS